MAGLHAQVETGDELLILRVGEVNVLELHESLGAAGKVLVGGVGGLLFGVEKLKDALGRGHAGLHLLHHAAELAERLVELAGVLDKCSGSAQSHVSIGHAQTTQDRNGHIRQVGQELHDGHHDAGQELSLSCGAVELLVALVEFLRHGLGTAEDDG